MASQTVSVVCPCCSSRLEVLVSLHDPKESRKPIVIPLGKDGRCTCDCGTPCPLGRMGMEYRCTQVEIERAGYYCVPENHGEVLPRVRRMGGTRAVHQPPIDPNRPKSSHVSANHYHQWSTGFDGNLRCEVCGIPARAEGTWEDPTVQLGDRSGS